jgi:superfamily II DNA or RNA helicase
MIPSLWRDSQAPLLRPFQVRSVEAIEAAWDSGRHAPLLALPTGAGKTVVFATLTDRELTAGGEAPGAVIVSVPRRELIGQTVDKLGAVGIAPGVVCAGMDAAAGLDAPVLVCSVDTLHARVQRRDALVLPRPRLFIADEAHLMITARKVALVEQLRPERILGCTATPTRRDGRALGVLFDTLVEPATVSSLTAAGFLVPARPWSWPPDLRGVRIDAKTKDYQIGDLAAAVNQPKLVGDIVEHWLKLAGARRTVAFTVDIKHAVALAEAFRRVGVAAEFVSAQTPRRERTAILARFRSGETQVVCNCFVLAYGFDLPEISCVILARPTKSLMLYLQMVGRALRPAAGKADCLVLDHAGAVHRHGFIADERRWTLDGHTALVENATRTREPKPATVCPNCDAIFTGTPTCPECGYKLRPKGRMVETLAGDLVELGAEEKPDTQERQVFYLELRGYASDRSYKPGWAAYKYRERHGSFPPWSWNALPVLTPSPATLRWIKSRQIAWARGKGRAA